MTRITKHLWAAPALTLTTLALTLSSMASASATPTPTPTPSSSSSPTSTPTPSATLTPSPTPSKSNSHSSPRASKTPTAPPSGTGSSASATPPSTGPTNLGPTPNPEDVERERAAAALAQARVAALLKDIGANQKIISSALNKLSVAQETYNHKMATYRSASASAVTAKATYERTVTSYNSAHTAFISMVVQQYEQGTPTAGLLLTSSSPEDALNRIQLGQMLAQNQAGIVSNLTKSKKVMLVAKTRADSYSTQAKNALTSAQGALATAGTVVKNSQAAKATLVSELATAKKDKVDHTLTLADYNLGATVTAPQLIAAAKTWQGRLPQINKIKLVPSKGVWTPAIGKSIAKLALAWVGLPYAWDGGNKDGPTYGVCAGDGAGNDCHIWGFDCSGLTLWAAGHYVPGNIAHYAASQYSQMGSFHPSVAQLQPGDLLYWSSNGAVSGIHHTAVWIGGGKFVEAPESGELVQVSNLSDRLDEYFGATRPLS